MRTVVIGKYSVTEESEARLTFRPVTTIGSFKFLKMYSKAISFNPLALCLFVIQLDGMKMR